MSKNATDGSNRPVHNKRISVYWYDFISDDPHKKVLTVFESALFLNNYNECIFIQYVKSKKKGSIVSTKFF